MENVGRESFIGIYIGYNACKSGRTKCVFNGIGCISVEITYFRRQRGANEFIP